MLMVCVCVCVELEGFFFCSFFFFCIMSAPNVHPGAKLLLHIVNGRRLFPHTGSQGRFRLRVVPRIFTEIETEILHSRTRPIVFNNSVTSQFFFTRELEAFRLWPVVTIAQMRQARDALLPEVCLFVCLLQVSHLTLSLARSVVSDCKQPYSEQRCRHCMRMGD